MTPDERESDASAEISAPAIRRDQGGRFVPGVSGNRSGRPKAEAVLRESAQAYGDDSIQTLFALTKSKNEKIALLACREILDRGYGRPRETIDLSAEVTPKMNLADLPTFSGDPIR